MDKCCTFFGKISFILAGILFFWLIASVSAPAMTAQENQKILFRQAQDAYNKAQELSGESRTLAMLKAAARFESLVGDYSVQNGYLYYNIGNAYYGAGKIGKAILNYRRAQQLVPGFRDLQYNLDLVRRQIGSPMDQNSWWKELANSFVFWHTMFDFSTRRLIAFLSFIFIWVLLIAGLFYKSVFLKAGTVLSILVTLGFGSSFLFSLYQINTPSSGVVIEKQTNVRKGPGTAYESFYQQPLAAGTEFKVVEIRGEWWKIRLANKDEAWINSFRAEII
jgi:tetratricopeptide (TPR) repeat protein